VIFVEVVDEPDVHATAGCLDERIVNDVRERVGQAQVVDCDLEGRAGP
jgi:hypothetical protein